MRKQVMKELKETFETFAKVQGFKIGMPSHFEGKKYQLAKPFTVCLRPADNRWAIVLNLPKGCISPITSFLPPPELLRLMEGGSINWGNEVKRYKRIYA